MSDDNFEDSYMKKGRIAMKQWELEGELKDFIDFDGMELKLKVLADGEVGENNDEERAKELVQEKIGMNLEIINQLVTVNYGNDDYEVIPVVDWEIEFVGAHLPVYLTHIHVTVGFKKINMMG